MKKTLAILGMIGLLTLNTGALLAAAPGTQPTISSVSPSSGSTAGGTSITINGTHLGGASVTIGGTAATNVVVAANNQSLTAVTPPAGPAAEDIVVTTSNGSALLEGGFTYTNGTTTGTTATTTATSTVTTTSTTTPSGNHIITASSGANGVITPSGAVSVADGGNQVFTLTPSSDFYADHIVVDGQTIGATTTFQFSNVTSDHTISAVFLASGTPPTCNGSTFDNFATGTVNGQGGWHVSGTFDQDISDNSFGIGSFGCKTLRISNAITSQVIFNQIFSNGAANEAGETDAIGGNVPIGTRQNHFEAQFDLASVTPFAQPGMHLSVSADRGDGTRMTALGFADDGPGIDVFFQDFTGTTSPVQFNETQIASLPDKGPHTIKIVMDFNDGPSNDVVNVFIDGVLVHTGTSFENFYRFDADTGGPTPDHSRTVNALVFYEQNPATPANNFKGFLVDNITLSTSPIPPASTSTDTTAPVITLLGAPVVDVLANTSYTDAGATASDDVDGNITANIVTTGLPIDTTATGTFTIHYNVADVAGNHATEVVRTVNVNETSTSTGTSTPPTATSTAPTITLNGSSTMEVLLNSVFVDPGATAVDSASTSVPVVATGTVDTAIVGSNIITYTATDSNNNVASTTRTVNVVATSTATSTPPDTTPPAAPPVVTTTNGGGGGGGSSGFFPQAPGLPIGFVIAPLPGQESSTGISQTTTTNTTPTVTVFSPAGQVLGAAAFNFTRNLKLGMTGDDVLQLQNLLKAGGYLVINIPTRYFGPMTFAALKKWQKKNGISSTGFFGPISRSFVIR